MRVKHRLAQPQALARPVAVALEPHPSHEIVAMTLTSGGEVLVLWLMKEVRVLDLRNGTAHTTPTSLLSFNSLTRLRRVVVGLFQFEGQEGVFLAAPFRYAVVTLVWRASAS